MKSTRRCGFYHVRVDHSWSIAYWSHNKWYRMGFRSAFSDRDFDEVLEERITQPSGETK